MAVESTTYLVTTRYLTEDRSSTQLNRIAGAAGHAERATGGLKRMLLGVGAGLLGFRAFDLAKRSLIGFNAEMQDLQTSLSTVLSMQLHIPFAEARKEASGLFGTLKEMAKASPATTKDFVEMSSAIAGSVLQAGLGVKALAEITQGGILASQALAGGRSDIIATDIRQMLAGRVTDRDIFAQQLLGGIGVGKEQFNKIKDARKRAEVVRRALSQQSLKDSAAEFGDSFTGQLSTFQDQMQTTLGKVGKPLFAAITAELKKWNTWLENNDARVKTFVKQAGQGVMSVFRAAKEAGAFLAEHRDVILSIAKAALLFKGVQFAGGILAAPVNMIASFAGQLQAVNGAKGLGGFMSKLGIATTGLAALAAGAQFVADRALASQERDIKRRVETQTLREAARDFFRVNASVEERVNAPSGVRMGISDRDRQRAEMMGYEGDIGVKRLAAVTLLRTLHERGILSEGGFIDHTKLASEANRSELGTLFGLRISEREAREYRGRSDLAMADKLAKKIEEAHRIGAAHWLESAGKLKGIFGNLAVAEAQALALANARGIFGTFDDATAEGRRRAQARAANVNVTIQRMEVPAKDPDRWMREFGQAVAKQVRAPRQARAALAGGF